MEPKAAEDNLDNDTVSAPNRVEIAAPDMEPLSLEELEQLLPSDSKSVDRLEDATMSIRPQAVGDTSIPTCAKPMKSVSSSQPAMATETLPTVAREDDAATMQTVATMPAMPSGTRSQVSRGSIPSAAMTTVPDGVAASDSPAAGELGFELKEIIGRGGYGEVFDAVQSGLGRNVAVKRLKAENYNLAMSSSGTARWLEHIFRQEAVTTALLEHPNIVPIHNFVSDEAGRPHLVMKLVRGRSWDKILEEDFQKMSFNDYLAKHLPILIDVAQAVGFAHAHGIIHRDLKPQQVVVGPFGEVILMDWGLALVYDDALLPATIKDQPQVDLLPRRHDAPSPGGSPAFMAPEQTYRTAQAVGPWTDIFMLGAILYAILTNTPPHRRQAGQNARAVFMMAAECVIEPPEMRAPTVRIPTQLADLALQCMRRDPATRLTSVSLFIENLQDYLTGASRRRESRALTDRLTVELANKMPSDYRTLSDFDSLLDQAINLWPDNPDSRELRSRILVAYVEAAMANGDLSLARVQAERIPESDDARGEMLAEIGVLENLADRETQEAREAEIARQKADSNRRRAEQTLRAAEASRVAAVETRAYAESLLEQLVKDLQKAAAGSSDAVTAAAQRIAAYFETTDSADVTDRMIQHRAQSCEVMAQTLETIGARNEAKRLSNKAHDYIEVLHKRQQARVRITENRGS